jgi:hypothetical protein
VRKSLMVAAVAATALGTALSLGGLGAAAPNPRHGALDRHQARNAFAKATGGTPTTNHRPDDGDLADQTAHYDNERTAPSGSLSGDALVSAQQPAAAMPQSGGAWQEVTNEPDNAEPPNYTDPFWSTSAPVSVWWAGG